MNHSPIGSQIDKAPSEGLRSATGSSAFNLTKAVEELAEWLPSQAPLKDFIHHNTLHAFQDRPFHEALVAASRLYGAKPYLAVSDYQKKFKDGTISEAGLVRSLSERALRLTDPETRAKLFATVSTPPVDKMNHVRDRWLSERGLNLDDKVHPILFRLLSNYLDQGVAIWRMPHAGDTLWSAVGRLVNESFLPFPPLSDRKCKKLLQGSAEQAILFCLERLVGKETHYEAYLFDMLLAHAGWSGMVKMTEQHRGSLLLPRQINLLDMIAIELVLEYAFVERAFGCCEPLVQAAEPRPLPPVRGPIRPSEYESLQQIWHDAFEWTHYEDLLRGLEHTSQLGERSPKAPRTQAFFCIDDRETSLRRFLDEEDPCLETWGVAGFFGVDWLYQSAAAGVPTKLCPAPLKPKHLVREVRTESTSLFRKPKLLQLLHLAPSNTFFRGWLITQVLGIWHALRLALFVFLPGGRRVIDQSLSHIEPMGELQLLREGEEQTEDGLYLGYSLGEMVERVEGVLRSTGCTQNFSDLMVFVSHGASSANNPYFAAYDCGACSGRPGAPNARAIAWMANHPEVRKGLRDRGVDIPDSCLFLGAFHDTTRDEVSFFSTDNLKGTHQELYLQFKRTMESALRRNAKERCRKFEMVDKAISAKAAIAHVRQRAASVFEPRPELNHANNSSCVVGRRDLTRGLFLDKRAFLNSYDPHSDPTGSLLQGILGAAIPVCGGINLEYFFSRMDSDVYGASTKLPHNVMGLVGVANGISGDLLTGLPTQMTEFHEPVRLLMVVEQDPKIVLEVLNRNPALLEWVKNKWIHFACIHPTESRAYLYVKNDFVPANLASQAIPVAAHSEEIYEGISQPIKTHFIRKDSK